MGSQPPAAWTIRTRQPSGTGSTRIVCFGSQIDHSVDNDLQRFDPSRCFIGIDTGGGHLARLRDVYVVLRLSLDPEESRISWYNVEYAHSAGFRLTITCPSINLERPLELEAILEMAKRRIDAYLVNEKTKRLAVRSVVATDLCAMPLL